MMCHQWLFHTKEIWHLPSEQVFVLSCQQEENHHILQILLTCHIWGECVGMVSLVSWMELCYQTAVGLSQGRVQLIDAPFHHCSPSLT